MSALSTICALTLLAPAAPLQGKSVTVPFELLPSGHMAVKVKVNGRGPYRLIFDTGAPMTLVSNKVARAAGLLDNVVQPAFPLFGSAGEVMVKRLDVGGQLADNIPAVVMDHPTIDAMARVLGPIDGIVGFPFFARFKTTLDYQAKTLTFAPSTFQPPDVLRGLMMALLGGAGDGETVKIVAPAAQWGFSAGKEANDPAPGLTVKTVLAGSSAAKAGLQAGDRLLTLDGRWTDTLADLFAAAEKLKPGTEVTLRIRRDGKERELRIRPAAGL